MGDHFKSCIMMTLRCFGNNYVKCFLLNTRRWLWHDILFITTNLGLISVIKTAPKVLLIFHRMAYRQTSWWWCHHKLTTANRQSVPEIFHPTAWKQNGIWTARRSAGLEMAARKRTEEKIIKSAPHTESGPGWWVLNFLRFKYRQASTLTARGHRASFFRWSDNFSSTDSSGAIKKLIDQRTCQQNLLIRDNSFGTLIKTAFFNINYNLCIIARFVYFYSTGNVRQNYSQRDNDFLFFKLAECPRVMK